MEALPGPERGAALPVALAKASLRFIGGANLADAIADLTGLTGLNKRKIGQLVQEAATTLQNRPGELRDLSNYDRDAAETLIIDLLTAASDGTPSQRRQLPVAALTGADTLIEHLQNQVGIDVKARAAGWSTDGHAYYRALLTTIAEYTTTWYHDDPTASHHASTAAIAQLLRTTARIEQTEAAAARARDRSEETLREYRRVAAHLAPGLLEGRHGELAVLTRFAVGEGQWWWWEAPAFAGKTALVARWVADFDEPGVRVVATFLRERSGMNTAGHILSDWVNQLSAICGDGQPGAGGPDELAVTSYAYERLRTLIVAACRVSRRIVLVVDGLDEYNPEHPVEDWLPELELPSNAALLVTSRLGAPNKVPRHHPLREHLRTLTPSIVTNGIYDLAVGEIKTALDREVTEFPHRILGLCTAARGPLTTPDLAALLGDKVRASQVDSLVCRHLRRTVVQEAGVDGLVIAHPQLRAAAEDRLGDELNLSQRELSQWAGSYETCGWPDTTPGYLLHAYPDMLAHAWRRNPHDGGSLEQLVELATDPQRQQRQRAASGSHAAAQRELATAVELLTGDPARLFPTASDMAVLETAASEPRSAEVCANPAPNLTLLARCVWYQDHLWDQARRLPQEVIVAWALLGEVQRAQGLAEAVGQPGPRVRALIAVAQALADEGEPDVASKAAMTAANLILSGLSVGEVSASSEVALAAVLMAVGRPEEAGAVAHHVTHNYDKPGPYSGGFSLDIYGYTRQNEDNAEQLAISLAAAGFPHEAVQMLSHLEPWMRSWTYWRIACSSLNAERNEELDPLGPPAVDESSEARVAGLTSTLRRLRELGRHQEAAALLTEAQNTTNLIVDSAARSSAMVCVADGYLELGQPEPARLLLGEVVALVETVESAAERFDALRSVVTSIDRLGDRAWALEVAGRTQALLPDLEEDERRQAMVDIADTWEELDDTDQALAQLKAATEGDSDTLDDFLSCWRYAKTVEKLAASGKLDDARLFLRRIPKKDRSEVRSWVAARLARAGLVDIAMKIGKVRIGKPARSVPTSRSERRGVDDRAAVLAEALTAGGHLRQAEDVLTGAPDSRLADEARRTLAVALAFDGQPAAARRVAERTTPNSSGPALPADPATMAALAAAFAQTGRRDEALELLRHAETASLDRHLEPRPWILANLARALADTGETAVSSDAARRAWVEAQTTERKDDLYRIATICTQALTQAGDHSAARAVIQDLRNAPGPRHEEHPYSPNTTFFLKPETPEADNRTIALATCTTAAAETLVGMGRLDEATTMASAALHELDVLDSWPKRKVVAKAVEVRAQVVLARTYPPERHASMVHDFGWSDLSREALKLAVGGLIQGRLLSVAEQLLCEDSPRADQLAAGHLMWTGGRKSDELSDRARMLAAIATAYADRHDKKKATKIWRRAASLLLQAAKLRDGYELSMAYLTDLARCVHSLTQTQRKADTSDIQELASEAAREVRAAATRLGSERTTPLGSSWADLVDAAALLGMHEEAAAWAELSVYAPHSFGTAHSISTLVRVGFAAQAERVITTAGLTQRKEAVSALVTALIACGYPEDRVSAVIRRYGMDDRYLRLAVVSAVATAYADNGRIREAQRRIAHIWAEDGWKEVLFATVAKTECHSLKQLALAEIRASKSRVLN